MHVCFDSDGKQAAVAETKACYGDKSLGTGPNKTAELIFIQTGWKDVSDTVKLLGEMTMMIPERGEGEKRDSTEEKEEWEMGLGIRN